MSTGRDWSKSAKIFSSRMTSSRANCGGVIATPACVWSVLFQAQDREDALPRRNSTQDAAPPVAALVGDLATENDCVRLARGRTPVEADCHWYGHLHLDASMVDRAPTVVSPDLDFLFIENVGNLVCPASYDLGEDLRLVLLSRSPKARTNP